MILYRISGIRKLTLLVQNLFFNLLYQSRIGNRIKIFGWPIVSIHESSEIRMGKGIMLISDSYFSEPGIAHAVILRTLSPKARIHIGNNVGMSGGGICAATEVIIGNNVMFGANAFVSDTDFHPISPNDRRYSTENISSEPVIIEDNVFIGMNVLILKGVRIGENSIIGAGSIVTSEIGPNSIAVGIPAKVIRTWA